MQSVGNHVAACSGSIVRVALLSRGVFASLKQLTTQFPFRFPIVSATLEGHEAAVTVVATLEDGRLVSGSTDRSIKV